MQVQYLLISELGANIYAVCKKAEQKGTYHQYPNPNSILVIAQYSPFIRRVH
jgi:hypothetical protein